MNNTFQTNGVYTLKKLNNSISNNNLESMRTALALSRYFKPYMTITGVSDTETYTYKARGNEIWPVVNVEMHKPKYRPCSIVYIAVNSTANITNLFPNDLLYIGSQMQDRMFRGDTAHSMNFHHREMRLGTGRSNLVDYLRSGKQVTIYTVEDSVLRDLTRDNEIFSGAAELMPVKLNHPGYIFEQKILLEGVGHWAWNKKGADGPVKKFAEGVVH